MKNDLCDGTVVGGRRIRNVIDVAVICEWEIVVHGLEVGVGGGAEIRSDVQRLRFDVKTVNECLGGAVFGISRVLQ